MFRDPPKRGWNNHTDTNQKVLTVQSGKLLLKMAGQEWILTEGDVAYIPSHTTHTITDVYSGDTVWMHGFRQ